MLRRLAILSVFLLSLSGVVPAAVACALFLQGADCCPSGQPCEPAGTPTIIVSNGAPCCAVAPAPMRSVAAVSSQNDRRADNLPAPDHWVVLAHEFPDIDPSPMELTVFPLALPRQLDQQQTYLLTGRLRL
jgi:hypothetical protein